MHKRRPLGEPGWRAMNAGQHWSVAIEPFRWENLETFVAFWLLEHAPGHCMPYNKGVESINSFLDFSLVSNIQGSRQWLHLASSCQKMYMRLVLRAFVESFIVWLIGKGRLGRLHIHVHFCEWVSLHIYRSVNVAAASLGVERFSLLCVAVCAVRP